MLKVEQTGAITVVTLDRPEAMNALSRALRRALDEAIRKIAADDSVSVMILTGAGNRAFTAGLDLKELGGSTDALGDANATGAAENPVLAIQQCPKPVIGAINGVAITGGFELALACDVLIASSNARFADTHARVGIMPGWGLSQKLSRIIGVYRAKELSLTGNFLDAQTALDWGLVNRVVTPDELISTAMKLAEDMASIPADTLCLYKSIIDEGYAVGLGEGLAIEHRRSSAHNRSVTPESVEQRRAGIQARGRTQG
ncbi:MAG: enoyl-CoA hydratase [Hyphomicrobiales bacterium]|nr:enoyl-CoA hydratase [Hyphomicrobiales bacterium]